MDSLTLYANITTKGCKSNGGLAVMTVLKNSTPEIELNDLIITRHKRLGEDIFVRHKVVFIDYPSYQIHTRPLMLEDKTPKQTNKKIVVIKPHRANEKPKSNNT